MKTRCARKQVVGRKILRVERCARRRISERRVARASAEFCAILRKSHFARAIFVSAEKKIFAAAVRRRRRNFVPNVSVCDRKKFCVAFACAHTPRSTRSARSLDAARGRRAATRINAGFPRADARKRRVSGAFRLLNV